jgi:hypothetical protein
MASPSQEIRIADSRSAGVPPKSTATLVALVAS